MTYADISSRRKVYNISQTKLAVYGGFSKALISAWELGKQVPNDEQLKKLQRVMSYLTKSIDAGDIDLQKKRIRHSGRGKTKLPSIINNLDEYVTRCSDMEYHSDYAEELQSLLARAQKRKYPGTPKGIALFSGCGGMSLGFEAAGFDIVGHVDINDSANAIYAANFPKSKLLGHDINKITNSDIALWKQDYGNIDIIIGGPPCQGFSLAGKRNPNDERNKLYQQYVRIVSGIHPKIFVMENVALMASMKDADNQLFFDRIRNAFEKEGYILYFKSMNAQCYGVPQSRERMILVGLSDALTQKYEFPEPLQAKPRTFRYATGDLQSLESGEWSEQDPLHWAITHPTHVIEWIKDVPEGHSAHENVNPKLRPPSGFNTTYKRIMWNQPCSTISTNFSMISGCRNVHPENTRSITIREAARAQSFPDSFAFVGNWGEIRKAIGNAVPPILATIIADSIWEQFF